MLKLVCGILGHAFGGEIAAATQNPQIRNAFSFHSLRHTYATRMLEKEVPAKVVSEMLGHSDVTTTLNIYSQVFDTTAHDQAGKLNSLFAGKVEPTLGDAESAKAHYPQCKALPKKKPPAQGKKPKSGMGAR